MLSNISAELGRNNMTIEQLSELIGVSRTTISNWIKGKTSITAMALIKMSQAFHCSTDYLLGLDNDRRSA